MSPVATESVADRPAKKAASPKPARAGPVAEPRPSPVAAPAKASTRSASATSPAPLETKPAAPALSPSTPPAPPKTQADVMTLQAAYGNAAMARAATSGTLTAATSSTAVASPTAAAGSESASTTKGAPLAPGSPVTSATTGVADKHESARAPEEAHAAQPAASAPTGARVRHPAAVGAVVREAVPKSTESPAAAKAADPSKADAVRPQAAAGHAIAAHGEEGGKKPAHPAARESMTPVVSALHRRAAAARKHSAPGIPVASAQAAAIRPSTEQTRTAALQTVANLGAAKTGQVKRDDFKAKLRAAIEQATPQPKTEAQADELMKTGATKASNIVKGELASQNEAAAGQMKSAAATDVPASSQPEPPQADLKPEPMGAAPAPVAAGPAVPPPLPPEQLDYSSDRAPTDSAMAEAGVTKEQLEQGNEPEFKQTLSSRANAEQHEAAVPQSYRKNESNLRGHVEQTAHAEISQGLAGMHAARAEKIGKVVEQQHTTKSKHAAEHQRITGAINGIKNKTRSDVEEILTSMETEAAQIFEEGLAAAEKAYEDTFEDAKGGTWTWLTTWGSHWEKLIENSLGKARDQYLVKVGEAIDKVADCVDAKLEAAKRRVADGRSQVETFVKGLDDGVRHFGEEALKAVSTDFDQMTGEIDQRRDALVDKLTQQYKASYERMSAMEEKLREENKSLWQRIYDATVGLIKKILAFKDMLLNVLSRAAGAIGLIIAHPIAFLGNLVDAGKLGFSNFTDHIVEHLKKGFMEWLFGAVAEAGITLPDNFDLSGILSIILQVLGLTYANIRARAVKILGEKVVKTLETTAEIFKILVTKGPAGLWEYIKDKIGDLKTMVVEKIKSFVMEKIIMAGITWIIGLLNPASAFFKACKAIYDIIMFFVEHGKQILDLINAIIDSISSIAKGAIGAAAAFVEGALAKGIPVAIGFLAALLGVGGISEKIKEVINAIREPINAAIDWVINKAVDLVKAVGGLLGVGKEEKKKEDVSQFTGQVGRKLPWTAQGLRHDLWIVTDGASTAVMVASKTKTVAEQLTEYETLAAKQKEDKKSEVLSKIAAARAELAKLDTKAADLAVETKKPQPDPTKESNEEKEVESSESNLVSLLKDIQEALGVTGDFGTEKNPIPLDWPKRRLADYPIIYVGPETGEGGARIEQEWLRTKDRKSIQETLGAGSDPLKKWEAEGSPILAFRPDEQTSLPNRSDVGVAPKWRVEAGMKIAMDKPEGTGGGGKINARFKPYGYRAQAEKMDGDHIVERQVGGEDEIANLWPLDSSENSSGGATLRGKKFQDPGDGEVTMESLKDKAKKGNTVWFQIVSTK